jgi:hypothetical protein
LTSLVSTLDHLVIVAATLEQGVAFCENFLGVRLLKGGEHVRTGTHNYLLNLGDGVYLEVIAINPAATALTCPRWFGMDHEAQRQRAKEGPYLATFAVSTNDIACAFDALPELGPVRDMQRGMLRWQITIPDDGGLVEGGAIPTVIQWPQGVHPTRSMPDMGCRLAKLEVYHPQPALLKAAWARIGLQTSERLFISQAEHSEVPRLVAHIATPNGLRTIT